MEIPHLQVSIFIRTHHRDETWSDGLWKTFFTSCVGPNIPDLPEFPVLDGGSWKFQIDTFGDHLCTCTTHSGDRKTRDSRLGGWSA